MKLSIVTINYNNASGLKKTLDSVAHQQLDGDIELEHIIIDGASTDASLEIAKEYQKEVRVKVRVSVKVISEPDTGIYNAMNKGIRMATGEYIQILNSGDILASNDVVVRMYEDLKNADYPEILYGNMLKAMPGGKLFKDNCGGSGVGESFLYFYKGTLNHDCAWIKYELFERFGFYDEDMRICSDWKWYIDAIIKGGVKPVYTDIDVTIFDMNGISENSGQNKAIIVKERRNYLQQILYPSVLNDYDRYSFPIEQYNRLNKYNLWGIIYFVERVFFKLEKWRILKR